MVPETLEVWALKSPIRTVSIGWNAIASLVEEVEGVYVGGFEVRTMFWGEIYSEDIEVVGLAYCRTLDFDGEATWLDVNKKPVSAPRGASSGR